MISRGNIKPRLIHNPHRTTLPEQDQKDKGQSNQTCTTHENEFSNKKQLQYLVTNAQESKRGNPHEQHR